MLYAVQTVLGGARLPISTFSDSFVIDGPTIYRSACEIGYEGIVSKVAGSPYVSGRGPQLGEEAVRQAGDIDDRGFALDEGKWEGIYLGRHKDDKLIYAGKVDHGFDKASAADLQKRLKPLIRKTQPYAKRIAHKGIWVEPKLGSSTEQSPRKARCAIHSSRARGRTCELEAASR
jgi:bifunctional non-homologous end joining protein LigD